MDAIPWTLSNVPGHEGKGTREAVGGSGLHRERRGHTNGRLSLVLRERMG